MMTDYQFSVIIPTLPMTPEEMLDAADALGSAGCTDASVRGHVARDRNDAGHQVSCHHPLDGLHVRPKGRNDVWQGDDNAKHAKGDGQLPRQDRRGD
jgi:hypothetical protein